MDHVYMLTYHSYTGSYDTEWYDGFYEAYQRYEELRTSGKALKCAIYAKMIEYKRSKAE